jgi:methionine synthase II (cobalamin-independent)
MTIFLALLKGAWGLLSKIPWQAWVLAILLFAGWYEYRHIVTTARDEGRAEVRAEWDAANAAAAKQAAAEFAKELRNAADVGNKMVGALLDVAAARTKIEVKTRTIVQEVTRAIDQSPDLGQCLLPDSVLGLRNQQYADIEAATAADSAGRNH